ncbi:BTB/POZ domain-containing protein 3-like isoform X2 [Nilaparvata lugens]|uniref:BTB/POZ domain-containing protein 3-like isoform X2 n=1 Tax=Nilaparvata lugens TaxID=108931 RepID=UPI00193DBDAB|nr:BTB/POZ domain-containing protein 3-like isoform X2 [Nilaparvata lugens]
MSSEENNGVTAEENIKSEEIFFTKRFHRLADSDVHSDCEFVVGSEKKIIKGHKLIFSAASDVFDAMFFGPFREDNSVNIVDLRPEGFEGMKTFIYTNEICFNSVSHALFTYTAAQKYLVTQLENVCIKFIEDNLKPSQVLEFYELCKLNCITKFKKLCTRIIQDETDEVIASDYFVSVKPKTMKLILKSPTLKLNSEIDVFDNFERWALAEAERRAINDNDIASSFDDLKEHIRFLTIKGDELAPRIIRSKLLTEEEKYSLAFNKLKTHSIPLTGGLSLFQHRPRKFLLPPNDCIRTSHSFYVPINDPEMDVLEYVFGTYKIHAGYHSGFIFIWITCHSRCVKKVLHSIKYTFRIQAKYGWNDIVYENEYSHLEMLQNMSKCLLAAIPVNKLQHFPKSDENKVKVQAIFNFTKINLKSIFEKAT